MNNNSVQYQFIFSGKKASAFTRIETNLKDSLILTSLNNLG